MNRIQPIHKPISERTDETLLTWASETNNPDPLIYLCAEHDRVFAEYLRIDQAYDRGELSIEDLEQYADPILDHANALTERICASQAISIKGLELQYKHFVERMADNIRSNFCDEWAVIFDNMLTGFEQLTDTSEDVPKSEHKVDACHEH